MEVSQNFMENEEKKRYEALMEQLAQWPEWKLRAMCLDESDLQIKREVEKRRPVQTVS